LLGANTGYQTKLLEYSSGKVWNRAATCRPPETGCFQVAAELAVHAPPSVFTHSANGRRSRIQQNQPKGHGHVMAFCRGLSNNADC